MKVFISGGTGFVGSHLTERLLDGGHHVVATGTRPRSNKIAHDRFQYISADTACPGPWQAALADADAVVNLAGRTIFSYWTEGYKKQMYDSRILTTRHIVEALPPDREVVLCSTSAVGCYGSHGDEILTEDAPAGDDFLAGLAADWEAEALRAGEKGVRVAIARLGIVLGKNGGAMKQMLPTFRMGLGGRIGKGTQWFPWVHLEDVVSGILFVIENPAVTGPLNFTAPAPVRQKEFARMLGKAVCRPAILPAPAFMLRLVMGELGAVLLTGQRALPHRLLGYGFQFRYSEIGAALKDIAR
ncbi:TIGR01777 family protein [Desulfonema ishimotonii]|uniref:TIGR01777 family protein n=1 Tax=Desulfonema ishimotonii TaxID=45657 RepID=A0A401G466_9BACT|nr:TIGR01777 family oxidoreductase [Desulfonema ishimotonii]GBC63991.1 TIGR01777 family protein [Desulfonema ishimotonii]